MATWGANIDWLLDVDRRGEPLLAYDRRGKLQHSTCPNIIQDMLSPVTITLFKNVAGTYTEMDFQEGAQVKVVGYAKDGTKLVFSDDFTVQGDGTLYGTLSFATYELDEALSDFPRLDCQIAIEVGGEYSTSYQFIFWVEILPSRSDSTPPPVDGNSYYTEDEADALFARLDGPVGYGTKLVTVDGIQMWAQLVGSKWVVNKVVDIDGQYYSTFVEVA